MRFRLEHLPLKSGLALAAILAMPMIGRASVIVAYQFGPNGTSFTYGATTIAPNVTASGLNSAGDFGTTTTETQDDGVGGASGWYTTNSGGNYLSVSNSSANSDTGYWLETIVTAAAGYEIDPTSFTLVGGAGGSSNTRSFLVFDNVDGLPTSIAATSGAPTVTGGDELGSGTFTAVRGTSGPPAMNSFTISDFTASDQNLTSFEVRVYFDTQLNGQAKNIDLGSLELDGSVVAVPEPATFAGAGLAAMGLLSMRRRRNVASAA
jgi:PEP-CTERM motif